MTFDGLPPRDQNRSDEAPYVTSESGEHPMPPWLTSSL
jgi:hypothetical protein